MNAIGTKIMNLSYEIQCDKPGAKERARSIVKKNFEAIVLDTDNGPMFLPDIFEPHEIFTLYSKYLEGKVSIERFRICFNDKFIRQNIVRFIENGDSLYDILEYLNISLNGPSVIYGLLADGVDPKKLYIVFEKTTLPTFKDREDIVFACDKVFTEFGLFIADGHIDDGNVDYDKHDDVQAP